MARSIVECARSDDQLAALIAGLRPDEALLGWGVQLLKAQRFIDAAIALRAATALAPKNPLVWTNLGLALDRSGSLGDAAACFERSLSLQRNQPSTWLLLALARKRLGDRSGCEADYRVALDLDPTSALGWQCLGLLKEEQREYAAAIDCFETCARCGPPGGAVLANLGKLYYQVGRIFEACAAYAAASSAEPTNGHYGQMLRKAQFLRDVLHGDAVDDALMRYERSGAANGADREDEREDERECLLEAACGQLTGMGAIDAATRLARKRLELRPGSVTAAYILSALLSDPGVDQSPPEYIVESFDAFAENFEAKVVGVLGYDVPEKLGATIRGVTPPGCLYDTLDAGCGTGLCGPLLRALSRVLTGVDLSSKMLEQAGRRDVYDDLVRGELTSFLRDSPDRFDLIVAADVMIYFGDLAQLFSRTLTALRPGGLFAFSAEHLMGDGYRLQPSGRFAHAPSYIRSVAGSAYAEELCSETTIRLEGSERVRGNLFLFRRR